ncbi:hypothetical protein [Nonomuraea sp. NPDC049141]|uniref:hypothetical protein n=1 Tax=Nonomuraea sp. NPDC049141 TaxID=3155500 RepID=UPI0033CDCF4D
MRDLDGLKSAPDQLGYDHPEQLVEEVVIHGRSRLDHVDDLANLYQIVGLAELFDLLFVPLQIHSGTLL